MAERAIRSQEKMYISSNWILAKALRTVLSMVREWEALGRAWRWDSSHSPESNGGHGPRGGTVRHTRAVGLPRSQRGLSVGVSDPPGF